MATTIKLYEKTKSQLDTYREHRNESYDDVIQKLIFIVGNCQKNPELSKETLEQIMKARERIKKGKFLTASEAKKRLGLNVRS